MWRKREERLEERLVHLPSTFFHLCHFHSFDPRPCTTLPFKSSLFPVALNFLPWKTAALRQQSLEIIVLDRLSFPRSNFLFVLKFKREAFEKKKQRENETHIPAAAKEIVHLKHNLIPPPFLPFQNPSQHFFLHKRNIYILKSGNHHFSLPPLPRFFFFFQFPFHSRDPFEINRDLGSRKGTRKLLPNSSSSNSHSHKIPDKTRQDWQELRLLIDDL